MSTLALPSASGGAPVVCAPPCVPPLPTWEFHGDMRLRALRMDPQRMVGTDVADGYDMGRWLGSMLWRGAHARAFVQLGAHAERGRAGGPVRTDQSAVDTQQAWIGWQGAHWTTWLGRQELAYGTARLLSKRDGPNIRLAFDGVRASRQGAHWRVESFLARPVLNTAGAFDDRTDKTQLLWGVYATHAVPAHAAHWDTYLLGYRREHARFASGVGDESRRTLGARWFGTSGAWDWNVEAMAQWGQFQPTLTAAQDVRAWRVAGEGGVSLRERAWRPRLSLRVDAASGDANRHDARLGTFNALYAVPALVDTSLLAPANAVIVQPALTLHPHAGLELTAAWSGTWKEQRADAVYTVPMPLLPVPGTAGTSSRIGEQYKLEAHQTLSKRWSLSVVLARLQAGPALREAGGRSTNFSDVIVEWHW